MLRESILAALFAIAAALFSVGAGFEWGVGVALMIGAVLLAGLSVVVLSENSVALTDTDATDELSSVRAKRSTSGPLSPSEMMADLRSDDDVLDVAAVE